MNPLLFLIILSLSFSSSAQDTISVYFDLNSSIVTDSEADKLTEIDNPSLGSIAEIAAYCDTTGTNNYNQWLAQRRLNNVLELIDSEPKKKNVVGENQAASDSRYNAEKSRRVDIIFTSTASIAAEPTIKTKGAIVLANTFNAFVSGSEKQKTMDLSLLFIPGYPVLIKDSHPEIEELFELLNDHPNVDAVIHGHVCCADDFKLSYDRALMVYQYLTKRGIAKERLTYKGHSNKDPRISPEVNEADRLMNRRVTVDFIKK